MITVLLSGGIDSFITAALLLNAGYPVKALHFTITDTTLGISVNKTSQVEALCTVLKIPLQIEDITSKFRESVIDRFVTAFKSGATPNPCILCNELIKFGYLYELLNEQIATGHYVNKQVNADRAFLYPHKDAAHDQAYFLYRVPYSTLKSVTFPLGEFTKSEVISMGKRLGYHEIIGNAADTTYHGSTDICFVSNENLYKFLGQFIPETKGDIKDVATGQIVGEHSGLWKYTIGQRKGLGIGGTGPYFVVEKSTSDNTLFVSNATSDSLLDKPELTVTALNILHPDYQTKFTFDALIQHRYQSKYTPATISITNETNDPIATISTKETIHASTKGQSAAFYTKDKVLIGGGIIA